MFRVIAAAFFLAIAFSPAAAQSSGAGEGQRAPAERLFEAWSAQCRPPSEAQLGEALAGWPSGQRFRYLFHTSFAQPVDERLAGELEGNARRLLLGALAPLGFSIEATNPVASVPRRPSYPLLEIAGLGEALPPEAGLPGIYTGARWRGMLAFRDGDRCLAAVPFDARLRPPDAVAAVAFDDPSAAPYLEALEAGLLESLVRVVEALQGPVGLSRLALGEADWRLRTAAVERLNDQNLLVGIARACKAPWLRVTAVGKLTSQARLDEIVQHDTDADVRKAALDRLAELARRH